MNDAPVWKRDEIDSPCINICVIHPATRLCTGCKRSIDEIGAWSSLSPAERQTIMTELPTRQINQRRGGRAGRIKE